MSRGYKRRKKLIKRGQWGRRVPAVVREFAEFMLREAFEAAQASPEKQAEIRRKLFGDPT